MTLRSFAKWAVSLGAAHFALHFPLAFGAFSLESALEASARPGEGAPLERFVASLPTELRRNFTFVYQSRSPFKKWISPKKPRVVLFNNRADLILTFTGDSEAKGYDTVEAMRFDEKKRSFSLAAYRFEPSGKVAKLETKSCAECHGADTRPLFDSYPLWPGFYGSFRDSFLPESTELKNYRAFLKAEAKSGVYAKLDWTSFKNTSTPPFVDPKALEVGRVVGTLDDFPLIPNTRLGMALTELNRKRIFRKVSATPTYRTQRNEILSDLLRCDEEAYENGRAPASMLPSEDRIDELHSQLYAENYARIPRLAPPNRAAYPAGTFDMPELLFTNELARIDHFAARLGVDRSDWSMAMERGSNAFFDGILSGISEGKSYYLLEDHAFEILADWAKEERAMRPYFVPIAAYRPYGYPFGNRLYMPRARELCKLIAPL